MHNVLIIFYIAFSIGNLFILPELGNITCISMKNGKKRLSLRAKYRVLCMVNGKTAGG